MTFFQFLTLLAAFALGVLAGERYGLAAWLKSRWAWLVEWSKFRQ